MDRSGSKVIKSGSLEMIQAGGALPTGGSGPTGSSRTYPKGGSVSTSADFNPMKDSKRGGTSWCVGGV